MGIQKVEVNAREKVNRPSLKYIRGSGSNEAKPLLEAVEDLAGLVEELQGVVNEIIETLDLEGD